MPTKELIIAKEIAYEVIKTLILDYRLLEQFIID